MRLGRMVAVALQVDDRRPLRQDAVLVARARPTAATSGHVLVALADEHVVADADDLGQEGDHVGGLAHRLAVRDLRLALVEVHAAQAEQARGAGEGEARARRLVAEVRDAPARRRRRACGCWRDTSPRGSRPPAAPRCRSLSDCFQVSRKSFW